MADESAGKAPVPPRRRVRRPFLSLLFVLPLLASLGASGPASARDPVHDFGAWFMGFGTGSFARLSPELSRVRGWLDVQVRLLDDSSGYDQLLVRPGLGFAFTDDLSAWLGYLFVHTDPAGGAVFEENRIWQQLLWTPRFGTVGLQSRTRLEQRFLERGSDTGIRFRQLIKASWPFPFAPRFGLAAYDEIFVDLNDTDGGQDAGFAQNRFFAGPFWRLDEGGRTTLELGYLNQFIRNAGAPERVNHIVSLHLLWSWK